MKLSSVTNTFARYFIVFIIAYLWLSFYIRNLFLVFLLSFAIAFFVNYIFGLFQRRKNIRNRLNRDQQNHMRQIVLQLKFLSLREAIALLSTAFLKLYPDAEKNKILQKKLVLQNNDKKLNIFPMFDKEPTTADIIAAINQTAKDHTTVIAANFFHPSITSFVSALDKNVRLMTAEDVYTQILSPSQVFPEIAVQFKSKKRLTFEQLKKMMFSRAKVRPYITIGIVILLTSLIVRFNFYYIIIATILFSFALISLFKPQENVDLL